MLKLAADLGLLDESLHQSGMVSVLLEQHLDRKVAAEVDVEAPKHRTHAAPGDLVEDPIAPVDRCGRRSIRIPQPVIRGRVHCRQPPPGLTSECTSSRCDPERSPAQADTSGTIPRGRRARLSPHIRQHRSMDMAVPRVSQPGSERGRHDNATPIIGSGVGQ